MCKVALKAYTLSYLVGIGLAFGLREGSGETVQMDMLVDVISIKISCSSLTGPQIRVCN